MNDRHQTGRYIPSYERKRLRKQRRIAHDLEIENANLRRRLAAAVNALSKAENRLREIQTFEAYLKQSCDEVSRRASIIAGKAKPSQISEILAQERQAVEHDAAKKGRPILYVSDQKYTRLRPAEN